MNKLTSAELRVAYYLCLGLTNQEIADRLHIREKTVKNHLTLIFRKLQVYNRTKAAILMLRWDERTLKDSIVA